MRNSQNRRSVSKKNSLGIDNRKVLRSSGDFSQGGSGLLPPDLIFNPLLHADYLQNFNQSVKNSIVNLDFMNFNIFELQRVSNGRELMVIGYEVVQRHYLLEKNSIENYIYINFLDGVQHSYND